MFRKKANIDNMLSKLDIFQSYRFEFFHQRPGRHLLFVRKGLFTEKRLVHVRSFLLRLLTEKIVLRMRFSIIFRIIISRKENHSFSRYILSPAIFQVWLRTENFIKPFRSKYSCVQEECSFDHKSKNFSPQLLCQLCVTHLFSRFSLSTSQFTPLLKMAISKKRCSDKRSGFEFKNLHVLLRIDQ